MPGNSICGSFGSSIERASFSLGNESSGIRNCWVATYPSGRPSVSGKSNVSSAFNISARIVDSGTFVNKLGSSKRLCALRASTSPNCTLYLRSASDTSASKPCLVLTKSANFGKRSSSIDLIRVVNFSGSGNPKSSNARFISKRALSEPPSMVEDARRSLMAARISLGPLPCPFIFFLKRFSCFSNRRLLAITGGSIPCATSITSFERRSR